MAQSSDIDVSILVVSYNTCEMTEAAIQSVVAETRGISYEIIVVDNASTDGSADMLAAHPAKPRLIALDSNIGFARANTLAGEQARGHYILLLNPDTLVRDEAISRLVRFAEKNPLARIWGGRTLFADGRLNPASCWGRMTPWNLFCRATGLAAIFAKSTLFNGEAIGGWDRSTARRVDIVSGCFFLIERELWNALGGFDPLFFMYGEEADLCLRARAFRAQPLITPTATIVHYGGASERVRSDKMVRLLSAKSSLISRHWHGLLQPVGHILLAAWPLSRMVATDIAARITGRDSLRTTSETWRSVWSRRDAWRHGYEQPSHSTLDDARGSSAINMRATTP